MKTIEKFILRSALLFSVLSLTACFDMNIDTQPAGEIFLETDMQSEYNRGPKEAERIAFNISSTTPWKITASENAEWCTVTPSSSSFGSLTCEAVVTLADNKNLEDRSVTLTLSADGLDKTYTTVINQTRESDFLVQPIDDIFPAVGGELSFRVRSNYSWTLKSENQWLSFDKESGDGSSEFQEIKVTASANVGVKRTSAIIVSDQYGNEFKFDVNQGGLQLEFVGVEGNQEKIPSSGFVKEYTIISKGLSWKAVCEDESVILTKKSSDLLEVKVKRNNLFHEKQIEVKLVPIDPEFAGLVESAITLIQPNNFYHSGSETATEYGEDGSVLLSNKEGSANRFMVNEKSSYGTFIWKFKNINLNGEDWLDIQFWPDCGGANFHFYFGCDNAMTSGGSNVSEITGESISYWEEEMPMPVSKEILKSVKEIKITVLPLENHFLEITVYLNGEKAAQCSNRPDMFYHMPNFPMVCYFGISRIYISGYESSSVEIESFDMIPLEK